jgi:hypothetical protein
MNAAKHQQFGSLAIPEKDKAFLRQHVFYALDTVNDQAYDQNGSIASASTDIKTIISCVESLIYNISQLEMGNPDWKNHCLTEVVTRLRSGQENSILSGLRALKSLFQVYEFELQDERKPLFELVANFFPVLEELLQHETLQNSPNYIPLMVLICKNFYIANHVSTHFL